jgi:hypothetical protein
VGKLIKPSRERKAKVGWRRSLDQIRTVSLVGGSLVDQQSRIGILYEGDSQSSWTRAELEKKAKLES